MRMMDELRPLFLYSANKKVYVPIDEKDRRHNSSILLLTPSLESSSKLMKLPYIHNPNLFNSFYIDRNVMAYIDNVEIDKIEFDEKEEEAVSEAMLRNWNSKIKFKFDEDISIMDKKYSESVFNMSSARDIIRIFKLSYTPEVVKIFIYPNLSSLRKDAPKNIENAYGDKLYSYSNNDEIHIISKRVYDPETMGGTYDMYLKNELICNLLMQANPDLPLVPVCAIAQVISGITDWAKENDADIGTTACNKMAKVVYNINGKNRMDIIHKFIKTGDINVFSRFAIKTTVSAIKKLIFENQLSYFERQRLLPSDFGVPDKRKYPIHDEEHVRLAIQMFNNCDPSDEKELAESILKRIEKFGMTDIKVGASNRFRPYYDESLQKKNKETIYNNPSYTSKILDSVKDKAKENLNSIKDNVKSHLNSILKQEIAINEGTFNNSDYEDILTICNHLSNKEFSRISFYDTYRNSKFVIKRIIKRVDGNPAGFLDVYQFPSKPEIAQIVIAVSDLYRGRGIADEMVKELLNSDLHNTHGFSMYYWTAHPDNEASKNLAIKNRFIDTKTMDNYGRNVYINTVKELDHVSMKDIPEYLKPMINGTSITTENAFVTSDMALISEANNKEYSQRMKKYLYQERIKNNKGSIEFYEKIKETNPEIKRTYIKIEMYKRLNLFVDLSYYHSLFLKNNNYKLDRGINLYFDFLNKLINNKEIDSEYSKKTIFIPVDADTWPMVPNSEVWDYKKNINPISMICRLIRTNPAALRKAWGNKSIIFVGSRGYFVVDFKKFELNNLTRFKSNIDKLMSTDKLIVDDYEADEIEEDSPDDDESKKNSNTSKALTAKMIDKVEKGTSIKMNSISTTDKDSGISDETIPHLQITNNPISLDIKDEDSVAIISIDPDGPKGFNRLSKTVLANIKKVYRYCIPKL